MKKKPVDHSNDWYFRNKKKQKSQFTKKEKKKKWRDDYLNHVRRGTGEDRT